jgi:WD40 repeat protein
VRILNRAIAVSGTLAVIAAFAGITVAVAVSPAQDRVVGAVPSTATPNIVDGTTFAIAKVGNKVVVGGTFTAVTDRGTGTSHARPYIFSFDATTGLVDTAFAPQLNNEVSTLLPGPTAGTVYVGGKFNSANGVAGYSKLVLLNVSNGALVTGFKAPAMNGQVMSVKVAGGRLFVGGYFTTVGSATRNGLTSLNPSTGDFDSYLDIALTGHHNYNGTGANAPVGAAKIDITPDGSKMIVIGNFKTANNGDYDQAVLIDLAAPAAVIANWHTNRYDDRCAAGAFDKWVRDVDFSPDGSYFVIVTTGGPNGSSLCDTAARWETGATGTLLQPTWADWTGGDTLLSVAVTGTAVYTGGHQRWMNNHEGGDSARQGAVARPGKQP